MNGFEESIKYNLLYVDKYTFGKSWRYEESRVPYSMLRYIVDGQGVFGISGKTYEVKAGQVVYIPEGSLLECESKSSKFSFISVRFKASVFFEGADFLTEYYGLSKIIEGDKELEGYFVAINQSSKDHSSTRMLKMHGNLELLIANLIEKSNRLNRFSRLERDRIKDRITRKLSSLEIQEKMISKNLGEDPRISIIIDYILTHPTERYSLPNLSKMADLSETSFRRLFKKQTGKSPNEFIRDQRLMSAARLLLLTDDHINDIAYEVGFEDVNYFIRVFKTTFGTTPRKYRMTAHEYI